MSYNTIWHKFYNDCTSHTAVKCIMLQYRNELKRLQRLVSVQVY